MIVHPGIPENLRWFDESRFGMFIHFGLYALLGRGEWVMYHEHIPRSEYRKLMNVFNPEKFSADNWVGLAKEAGARYITVTAKHHDGFCLFDSSLTDYKITNTPFGRGLIGELVDACHRADMRIIFYYSQPDWYHPNFVHNRGAFKDLPHPPPTDKPDWEKYVRYFHGQVRELCTNYGRIDGIWFDGSHKTVEEWRGKEVYDMIKKLQPNAVVNDRARWGDFFTPERSLPDDLTGYMFEACESISPTAWGYQDDMPAHTVPHLVKSLVRMAAAGGNYLLNVGPKPDGTITGEQAAVMHEIGKWLAKNGESIYGSHAGPRLEDPNIRVTRKGTTLYLHLLEWPARNRIVLPNVIAEGVKEAAVLGSGLELEVVETDNGAELRGLAIMPPDPLVNVIRVEFFRLPEHFEFGAKEQAVVVPHPVPVSASSPTHLTPETARLEGLGVKGVRLRVRRNEAGKAFISGWMVPDHAAHWDARVEESGHYRIDVVVSAPETHAGAVVKLVAGSEELTFTAPETRSLDTVETVHVGTVELTAGVTRITVRPEKLKWGYLSPDIAEVVLTPVG
ncbi:MAG: Alpha-L-fucosidase [Candidatus Latescibacteria bacterium ADurb.Bin168]|nr:MAG: Alpha-L-fucosidase [Candidatus Latescibacteria bacterium ADurb.Bin168]